MAPGIFHLVSPGLKNTWPPQLAGHKERSLYALEMRRGLCRSVKPNLKERMDKFYTWLAAMRLFAWKHPQKLA